MTLTPFERAQAAQERTALLSATITATREMVDLGHECDISDHCIPEASPSWA